jgi:hypothetical protein
MPRGDGTGPNGAGPMTGRGMGYCSGYNSPGFANAGPGYGRGIGYGRGRGMGYGRGYWRTTSPVQSVDPVSEKEALNQQKDLLSKDLELIKDRISQLEDSSKKEK